MGQLVYLCGLKGRWGLNGERVGVYNSAQRGLISGGLKNDVTDQGGQVLSHCQVFSSKKV